MANENDKNSSAAGELWETLKYPVLGVAGLSLAMVAISFAMNPVETAKKVKNGVSEIFGNSASETSMPDCDKGETKTVVMPSGNSYIVSCTRK